MRLLITLVVTLLSVPCFGQTEWPVNPLEWYPGGFELPYDSLYQDYQANGDFPHPSEIERIGIVTSEPYGNFAWFLWEAVPDLRMDGQLHGATLSFGWLHEAPIVGNSVPGWWEHQFFMTEIIRINGPYTDYNYDSGTYDVVNSEHTPIDSYGFNEFGSYSVYVKNRKYNWDVNGDGLLNDFHETMVLDIPIRHRALSDDNRQSRKFDRTGITFGWSDVTFD